MLYKRCKLLLLSQSGFKQRLSEILTDKFHQLQHFIFARFLPIEDYGKYALRKETVITAFVVRFKTATSRRSS